MTADPLMLTALAISRARRILDRRVWCTSTSLTALTRGGRGVPYDPAAQPRPITVRWSEAAHSALPHSRPQPPRLIQHWETGRATLEAPNL